MFYYNILWGQFAVAQGVNLSWRTGVSLSWNQGVNLSVFSKFVSFDKNCR